MGDVDSREIVLVYARARNGAIGVDGGLPWHIPADLKRFKAMTMGRPMIMGRKTFESFPSPLPGRRHIVLTRDADWSAPGAEAAHSVADALVLAGGGTIFAIGGAEIIAAFEPLASRIEETVVELRPEADTFVEEPGAAWKLVHAEDHPADGARPAFSFHTLLRREEEA